jgi:hypothetical protein
MRAEKIILGILFSAVLVLMIALWLGPRAAATQPAQIEEIAHTNTLAVYRVQDGGCTVYLAQGVTGAGAAGPAAIALTPRCQ